MAGFFFFFCINLIKNINIKSFAKLEVFGEKKKIQIESYLPFAKKEGEMI